MTASARRRKPAADTAPVEPDSPFSRVPTGAGSAPGSGNRSERQATVHQAKTHLSRLLAEVEAGGTVVITRRGKPVARLEAVQERPKRVFGSMKGLISIDERFFEPLPEEELKAWEGG